MNTDWIRTIARGILGLAMLLHAQAASSVTFTESFSANPLTGGWQVFGTNSLFTWDSTNQNLRVTWDSSKPNNYFHHPLGTIITTTDDFSLAFDLRFDDYASGVNPLKPGTFQAAIGFLNMDQAARTNFFRGAGTSPAYGPVNIVEFDFFPAFDTFSPTIAQTVVGTNSAFANWHFNHDNQQEMTPGETFRVTMNYSAATRTLTTTLTNQAAQYGPTQTITIPGAVDFRITTLAISSFSDAIQPPPPGSILAHGIVDNIAATLPPPPVESVAGQFASGNWSVQFVSRTNWLYTLQRTTTLAAWTDLSPTIPGNGAALTLTDTNPPNTNAFYRVRASKP